MSSKVNRRKVGRSIAAINITLFSLCLLTLFGCKQSGPIPAVIVGDSMAPLLCGDRISVSCPQCEIAFDYGINEHLKTVHCPNCGCRFSPAGAMIAADRVDVLPNQAPRRWDIVAFGTANDKTLIKRIVGLPGETIMIADGEIFVDEKLVEKPAAVVQQTKRQVFDSIFSSPQIQKSLELDADHWKNQEGELVHSASDEDEFDWIVYRHFPKYSNRGKLKSTKCSPIKDDDGFNQSLSRRLHVVPDLIVQTDLMLSADAEFRIVRRCRGTTYQATIVLDKDLKGCEIRLSFNDAELKFRRPYVRDLGSEIPITVVFSNIDRSVKLVVNRETIVEVPEVPEVIKVPEVIEDSEEAEGNNDQPYLKFGLSRNSKGRVKRCRIWRDIFYFAQRGLPKFDLPMKLGLNEYFVVGDNVPVSQDSRHFGAVTNIIGTVDPLAKNRTVYSHQENPRTVVEEVP